MGSEWQEKKLGELFKVKHGFAFKGEHFADAVTPHLLTTPGNFSIGGGFQNDKPKYYNGPVPDDYILNAGDIIVTMTDLSKASDTLGNAAIVPEDSNIWLHNQRVGLLVFRDPTQTHPKFVSYLLRSHEYRSWIVGSATGTTVKHTSPSRISEFVCPIPPLSEQKAIAHILGSLDDKIELNRRINATLEGMAQALFKSWFVDFDPVIDNALAAGNPIPDELAERAEVRRKALADGTANREAAKQFPAAFQLTEEMGWIPEGWKVKPMPEVTTFREGPGILAKDFHDQGVPLIRLAGLKSGVSLLDGCNFLNPIKVEKKWSQFRLLKGDILLSSSASLGRVAEVDDEAIGAIPYTGIIGFRPIEERTLQRYIQHYLTSSHFQDQVVMMGAGSVLNHFGPTHLKKMNMLIPLLAIQKTFSDLVDPQDREQYRRLKQSDTITNLRDTLLPKLISGEIRIPEAEKLTEEALA